MSTPTARASLLAALVAAPVLALAEPPVPEAATEAQDAHALYETNCLACHGSEVYTREDRKVDSLAGLEAQVRRCDAALGLRWFDEDIGAVTNFLNDRFYGFKP